MGGEAPPKICSKTPPTRGQLTQSDYLGSVYSIFDGPPPGSPDDVRQMATDLEELGQEQQEKFDNMPEGLQQGDTGQMIEERANSCEEKAQELNDLADEWETAADEAERQREEYEEELAVFNALPEDQQDDASEPDEPEEFHPQEFIDRLSECEPE